MKGPNNEERDGGGRLVSTGWTTTYGAARGPTSSKTCSLIFANVNTFPKASTDPYKKDSFKDMLAGSNLFAFNEHNHAHLPYEQINQILPSSYGRGTTKYSSLPHSSQDTSSPGGAGIVLDHILSKFIHSSGNDKKLGRWSWYTLQGRQGRLVTVVSLYRAKPGWATYANQLHHLRSQQLRGDAPHFIDPSDLWMSDLDELLKKKCIQGPVIIGGDFNSNLDGNNNQITQMFERHGLHDSFAQYSNIPKHTHSRGSQRIDGIYTSFENIRAGYTTLEDSPSDHRWMFIEIEYAALLGHPSISFAQPPKKRVTCKIPKVVASYNDHLAIQMKNHKIAQLLHDLQDMIAVDSLTSQRRHDAKTLLDKITTQTYRAIEHAASKCRKIREGDIPFSPAMKHMRVKIRFYKLLYRRVDPTFRSPPKRRVKRFAAKAKYTDSLDIPPSKARELIRLAKREYKDIRPNLYATRKEFLTSLATDKATINGGDTRSHLKQLIHQERLKRSFRQIKRAVGKVKGGQVIKVEKENNNGSRQLLTERKDVEDEIMRVTAQKLTAANSTPLRQLPYSSYFGEHGDFSKWEQMVKGSITAPSIFDEDIKEWMTLLQSTMPNQCDPITWTPQEYADSWKLMKEDTGTGPGPTFSCLKAIAPGTIANKATSLIALTPLQTGVYPSLWDKAIEQNIPKKAFDLRANKLRRITLFAAQLNHNKKYLGKRMMAFGERHALLAPEQYGSRKTKSSIHHAWNKRMVVDWMLATHTSGVYIANDASGCYDRILLMVAYLTLRRQGIPEPAAFFSISCLLHIKYSIRTAWGTSTDSYGGDQWKEQHGCSPHGIGQGSGDGPGLWAGISSPIFDLMRSKGHGFEIISAITQASLRMAGFGFVDDTDLLHTLKPHDTITDLLPSAQRALRDWNKFLRITGGALEPSKSHYVYIEQHWTQGTWRFREPPDINLQVESPSGHIQPLERINPSDARLTLGLFQCIDGNEKEQFKYMLDNIHSWSQRLYTSHIKQSDAKIATSITINATLGYPLPATCLDHTQCSKLSTRLITSALPKMGVVRTASRALVFGPKSMGGLGLLDIRLQQLISHINMLIKFGNTDTVEGTLITSMMETHQLELGVSTSLLRTDPSKYPWISNSWLWFTLCEAKEYAFLLHAPCPNLSTWRENDSLLMDNFASLSLSTSEWRILNRTRLYLQVATVSDIADDGGHRLRLGVLSGKQLYSISSRAYKWPSIQTPPTPSEILLWSRCIKTSLLQPGTTQLIPRLRLSRWNHKALQHATWWQDPARIVYSVRPDGITSWSCHRGRRATRSALSRYSMDGPSDLPQDIIPTLPSINDDGTISTALSYTHLGPIPNEPVHTHWALSTLFGNHQQIQLLAASIRTNQCQLMSDGSRKDRACASCFLSVHDHNLGGTNIVPGHPNDCSAHRSEIGGLLGKILYVNKICEENEITSGHITSGCDCLNVVRKVRDINHLCLDIDHSCYDLLREIKHHLSRSPVTWTFIHIRGHQDKHTPFAKLNSWEQANVMADTKAKAALAHWVNNGRAPIHVQPTSWGVSIANSLPLSSRVSKQLLHHVRGNPLKDFWIHRLKQDDIRPHMIHWTVFSKMFQYASDTVKQFRAKHIAHITPTGVNLLRRRHREDDTCPHCGLTEDNLHLLTCPSPAVNTACIAFAVKLTTYLHTCAFPSLASILHDLFFWSRDEDTPITAHPTLYMPLQKQTALGPHASTWGIFSPSLVHCLQDHWQGTRRQTRSASVWFSKLAHFQWSFLQDLWHLRNTVLHQPNNKVYDAENERVDQDIKNLLDDIKGVPTRLLPKPDRHFFRLSHAAISAKPLKSRRRWLRQASAVYSCWLLHRHDPAVRPMLDYLLRDTDVT